MDNKKAGAKLDKKSTTSKKRIGAHAWHILLTSLATHRQDVQESTKTDTWDPRKYTAGQNALSHYDKFLDSW